MTTPIVELISENIKTAINEITVANGYNQTLIGYRPKREDYSDVIPENGNVFIFLSDATEGELTPPGKYWFQKYAIQVIVVDSDSATNSIETATNQVQSDIIKKLMNDPSRGGYATDTILLPSSLIMDEENGWTGVVVNIEIMYRVKIDDPYTQIA